MNTENQQTQNSVVSTTTDPNINYKEAVRKQIYQIVGDALDEETRQTTLELAEEREKAIKSIVEENKLAIKEMVEEGKKIIRLRAQTVPALDAFRTEYIDEVIMYIYKMIESSNNGHGTEMPTLEIPETKMPTAPEIPETPEAPKVNANPTFWMELEILPPRDQDEIEAIKVYLNSLPQITSVELTTWVDKSVFKVASSEAVDFIEKLRTLPQVLTVKDVRNGEQGKIQITLSAKAKLSKNQEEMNAKVKKIFRGKK